MSEEKVPIAWLVEFESGDTEIWPASEFDGHFESASPARQGTNLRAMFEETNKGKFPRLSFERDKFGDYVDRSAEFAWKSLLSTLGHAERLQALEHLRLRIAAHMFIRENGELLGYGVTVPEMREFRELLIPFNGEIKIK